MFKQVMDYKDLELLDYFAPFKYPLNIKAYYYKVSLNSIITIIYIIRLK